MVWEAPTPTAPLYYLRMHHIQLSFQVGNLDRVVLRRFLVQHVLVRGVWERVAADTIRDQVAIGLLQPGHALLTCWLARLYERSGRRDPSARASWLVSIWCCVCRTRLLASVL